MSEDRIELGAPTTAPRLQVVGAAGAGYLQLDPQSAAPTPIAGNTLTFSRADGAISFIGPDGSTAAISLAGLTAARAFSFPDHDGTFATLAGVESFTNKTITGSTNIVHASALRTTGTAVTVSGAAPPTAGQVLTAVSGTSANWQTPSGGGGSSGKSYSLMPFQAAANSTTWMNLSYFTWINIRYSALTGGTLIYHVTAPGALMNIRFRDTTNNVNLATHNNVTTGFYTTAITNPGTDALLVLQLQKTNDNSAPEIYGVVLEFN